MGDKMIQDITAIFNDISNVENDNEILCLNNNLNELDSIFTCAHELGHALLHPNENTQFLMSHTYFSVDKLEMQANQFALELLLAPDVSEMYSEYTMEQLSRFLEVNNLLSQF